MGAFLENPLLLFVDDAEPILPIFRSPKYSDSGRIVELTDVGCDTESTFPVYFQRGAFDRRRGGAESFGSSRKTAKSRKWRNERSRNFPARTARTILDNFESGNTNYIREKARRNHDGYDDTYDLNYDLYAEGFYDDLELSRNDGSAVQDDYYSEYVNSRNIERFQKERLVRDMRYNYSSRDFEPPFSRSNRTARDERAYRSDSTAASRWFADNDERIISEARDSKFRSRRSPSVKRGKQADVFSRMDENFDHETAAERNGTRDNFSNATDSVAFSKDGFWDFVSLENEPNEESTFASPERLKNHGHSRKMTLQRRRSHNFDSRQTAVDVSERGKLLETQEKNRREDLSSKDPIGSARCRTLRSDAVTKKSKISPSNLLNTSSPRVRSAKIFNDEQSSNTCSTGKATTNARPRSAFETRKINDIDSPIANEERRKIGENSPSIGTRADDRRYRNNTSVKHFTKAFSATDRTSKCTSRSKNNERMSAADEKDSIDYRVGGSRDSKFDRTDQASLSRSEIEECVPESEKIFALRITSTSPPTEVEKEKKKSSRLPVRTWKRLRTKEPSTLRHENDVTNDTVDRKFQKAEVILENTTRSNNQPERADNENCEKIVKDSAAKDRDDTKRKDRHRTGSFNVGKSGVTSANLKDLKGTRGSNTKGMHEQRKKRTSAE